MTSEMLKKAIEVIRLVQSIGADPVLYGSLGVSLYLGNFKEFGDIDLLVDDEWLSEKWPELIAAMASTGFVLIDEREHEFRDSSGVSVAFAKETVLTRDGVVKTLDELERKQLDVTSFRTLSPRLFRKAYEFSEKDGYRKDIRGKKDRYIMDLLDIYLKD